MKNKFEIRGDVTAIFVTYKQFVFETLIDTLDLEKADSFSGTWFAMYAKNNQRFYAYGVPRDENGKQFTLRLHRFLTNCPKGLHVDHINHNTLDNRRSANLRIATFSQNKQNCSGLYKNNKSGVRGVYWNSRDQIWRGVVRVNKKDIHIGSFRDLIEAEIAMKEARRKYMPYSTN